MAQPRNAKGRFTKKAKTGRKGKGLFQRLRRVLTDQEHGPEMDRMLVLIGGDKARDRLVQASP